MAATERIDRGYLGTLLRLTLLAPDLLEASLDGRKPDGLALPGLEQFRVAWTQSKRPANEVGSEQGARRSCLDFD
jgi:hypothetical protein